MKKVFTISFLLLSLFCKAQNNKESILSPEKLDLYAEDYIKRMPELLKVAKLKVISVQQTIHLPGDSIIGLNVLIKPYAQLLATFFGIQINEHLSYVALYYPVFENNVLSGHGYIYLLKKENEVITTVVKSVLPFEIQSGNGKQQDLYILSGDGFALSTSNFTEIVTMRFHGYDYFFSAFLF